MKRWQVALAFAALAGVLVAVPAIGDSQDPIGQTVKALVKKQRQDRKSIKRLEQLVAKLSAPGYRAPIGPPGPVGAMGATGPTGATGLTGLAGGSAVVVRTDTVQFLEDGNEGTVRTDCEENETVVGGGASSDQPDMNFFTSAPTAGGGDTLAKEGEAASGWLAGYKDNSGIADPFDSVTVYVLCASP